MASPYPLFSWRQPCATTLAAAAAVTLAVIGVGVSVVSGMVSSRAAAMPKMHVSPLAHLPFAFEPNRGQTDGHVKFLSHASGYSVFLMEDAQIVLAFQKTAAQRLRSGMLDPMESGETLQMSLVGASGKPNRISGEKRLPGTINYFVGRDPDKWLTHVPTFGRVLYQGVYPGVDLVYDGSDQHCLEYDFHIAPGADPDQVRLQFQGAEQLAVNEAGDLTISLPNEEEPIIQHAPVAYQIADDGHRIPVQSSYRLTGVQVQFTLGSYDRSRPLVIAPSLNYSTCLGESFSDYAQGIAVDSSGSAYVVGNTSSSDFNDIFVAKLSADGRSLLYAAYLGGTSIEYGRAIAVDSSGNAYVTGYTSSTDFPTTPGAYQTSSGGGSDAFVAKLSSDGGSLVYSTYLGGSGADAGSGIAVDASGDAYVTGYTKSGDFPATTGAYQTRHGGGPATDDAFVTKLSSRGASLVYSTYLGGTGADMGNAIALDSSGDAYVTGQAGANFPTTSGVYQTSAPASASPSVFVTEVSASGSSLVYSTYVGGTNQSIGYGIAVDSSGNACVTGQAWWTGFPTTTGAYPTSAPGDFNHAFVFSLASGGSALKYSTVTGRTSGFVLDPSGRRQQPCEM